MGEVGTADGRGWHHFWARLVFVQPTSPKAYALQYVEMAFQRAGLVTFKPASPNPSTAGYSTRTKTPSDVRGQYFRVLNVRILRVIRAWSVPLGTQRKQKHLETCMASTREDVGPCPSWKLVLVKRLIISCLRDCLGLPVILNNPINR